jgi:hypothetical protein
MAECVQFDMASQESEVQSEQGRRKGTSAADAVARMRATVVAAKIWGRRRRLKSQLAPDR